MTGLALQSMRASEGPWGGLVAERGSTAQPCGAMGATGVSGDRRRWAGGASKAPRQTDAASSAGKTPNTAKLRAKLAAVTATRETMTLGHPCVEVPWVAP